MLPAVPERGNHQTSFDDGVTPEQALAVAVIFQAIADLQSSDELVRFEAHEFFLQPKGPWADMRKFYFAAVDLDDEWLREHLEHRLEPPERPNKKWSYFEVAEIVPTDRAFTSTELARRTSLHTSQMSTRLNILVKQGALVRLDPGTYCVPGIEEAYRHRVVDTTKELPDDLGGRTPGQNLVLKALRDGPMTAREIQIKTGGGSYDVLRVMVRTGLLLKDGTRYYLAPQSAVAA